MTSGYLCEGRPRRLLGELPPHCNPDSRCCPRARAERRVHDEDAARAAEWAALWASQL